MNKVLAPIALVGALTAAVLGTTASPASADPVTCPYGNKAITNHSYDIQRLDGTTVIVDDLTGSTTQGDVITVTFTIGDGCTDIPVSFASYRAPTDTFISTVADQQTLYSSDTGLFSTGTHTMQVLVPAMPGVPGVNCTNDLLTPDESGTNPFATTCDGAPVLNSNSENSHQPCAGCVGNADNRMPPGQVNNIHSRGYESADRSNPAHSANTTNHFHQVDLVRGAVLETLGPDGTDNFYGKQIRLLDTDVG